MKINGIKLSHLRNDEHFQFFANFIKLVNEFDAAQLNVATRFNTLVELHTDEDEALKKITKSDYTRLLHDADRDRDEVFRGLTDGNRMALNHFLPDVREAAIRLQIVFDTYGNVAKKGDAEETSAITNLISELTQHHAADMAKVGLGAWATELGKRNEAFNNLEMNREAETAGRTQLILMEARTKEDDAYRKLIERVEALALLAEDDGEEDNGIPPGELRAVKEAPPYAAFIAKLNALIERFESVLAIRKGKAKKSESGLKD